MSSVNDLFQKRDPQAPLAERLRPRTLDDLVGQAHLLGPGKPLRLAFAAGKPHSMILWGPPGVGKTGLEAMELRDPFGQITVIKFSTIERNTRLPPESFRFTPPKGADVISE